MNIALILQMAAEVKPERIDLVCDARRWSLSVSSIRSAECSRSHSWRQRCSTITLSPAR
jgi:hypothetical protein